MRYSKTLCRRQEYYHGLRSGQARDGGVTERPNVPVLKTGDLARGPRVQISPPPPTTQEGSLFRSAFISTSRYPHHSHREASSLLPCPELAPGPRETTTLRLGDSSGLVMEGGGNCFGDAHPIAAKGLPFPPGEIYLRPHLLSCLYPCTYRSGCNPRFICASNSWPGMTSLFSYTSTITCYFYSKTLIY